MKNKIIPNNLVKGDKIAILSTARKIDSDKLQNAIKVLNGWGLEVIEGENLKAEFNQFCGTDEQRLQDLQKAIDNDSIKAILCFRGGYGTVRILEGIDFTNLIKQPKWICGYSDVTALHNALNNQGIASLHSTMPINFDANTNEALESLRKSLFGEHYTITTASHPLNRSGEAQGEIIGGNLSMLYSLGGTKYDINTKGKILFIEDLDEYLYHIDRMMWNLRLGGKLDNLVGLIIGGMTDMNDNEIPFGKNALQIISEAVADFSFPVCFNFPIGHIDDNRTIPIGKMATLAVGQNTILSFS